MEGKVLHPEQDERGVWLFDAAEVEGLDIASLPRVKSAPSGAEGTIAARVFALLEQGQELSEIVIVTRTPPRVVRELYAQWLVTLEEGEQQRAQTQRATHEARERAREEREWSQWERQLRERMRG